MYRHPFGGIFLVALWALGKLLAFSSNAGNAFFLAYARSQVHCHAFRTDALRTMAT